MLTLVEFLIMITVLNKHVDIQLTAHNKILEFPSFINISKTTNTIWPQIIEHNKTTAYDVGNSGPSIG